MIDGVEEELPDWVLEGNQPEDYERRRKARKLERVRYRRIREYLIILLGGRCEHCHGVLHLHIDHVHGRDWEVRSISSHARMNRYWQEYKAGVALRILCIRCNGAYSPRRDPPDLSHLDHVQDPE